MHYLHTFLLLTAWLRLELTPLLRPAKPSPAAGAYLFVYFTGNCQAEKAICFALSPDGYRYVALNGNQPVHSSAAISQAGGVRDPHILREANGKTFYIVATDMV